MKKIKLIFVILIIFFMAVQGYGEEKIRIFTIVNTKAPLTVYLLNGVDLASSIMNIYFTGFIPVIASASAIEGRNAKNSKKLREIVGDYKRDDLFKECLDLAFKRDGNYFELVFPDENEPINNYYKNRILNYNTLINMGYQYALVINEKVSGYSTPSGQLGKLGAYCESEAMLFDIKNKDRIYAETIAMINLKNRKVDEVLNDKNLFISDYPVAVQALCNMLYGNLFKNEKITGMAKAFGLENKFRPVAAILAEYRKKFEYNFMLPAGWKKFQTQSDYQFIHAPVKDSNFVAVSSEVDLLIDLFGQKVSNLNDYLDIHFRRLQSKGYPVETLLRYQDDNLKFKDQYDAYIIDDSRGGKNILLFRMEGKEFVCMHNIILLGDYEKLLEKYKDDIMNIINSSKFVLK